MRSMRCRRGTTESAALRDSGARRSWRYHEHMRQAQHRFSVQEYLALEEASAERHEYYKGELIDQYAVDVEHRFLEKGSWQTRRFTNTEDQIALAGLPVTLRVQEMYEHVDFSSPAHDQ